MFTEMCGQTIPTDARGWSHTDGLALNLEFLRVGSWPRHEEI